MTKTSIHYRHALRVLRQQTNSRSSLPIASCVAAAIDDKSSQFRVTHRLVV